MKIILSSTFLCIFRSLVLTLLTVAASHSQVEDSKTIYTNTFSAPSDSTVKVDIESYEVAGPTSDLSSLMFTEPATKDEAEKSADFIYIYNPSEIKVETCTNGQLEVLITLATVDGVVNASFKIDSQAALSKVNRGFHQITIPEEITTTLHSHVVDPHFGKQPYHILALQTFPCNYKKSIRHFVASFDVPEDFNLAVKVFTRHPKFVFFPPNAEAACNRVNSTAIHRHNCDIKLTDSNTLPSAFQIGSKTYSLK